MEFREFRAEGVETDDKGKLRGLVTPFDRETTIGDMKRGGWKETVRSGCFRKTLKEADYLLVYQHDLAKPMARKSAGNLTFTEGELGGQRGLVMDSEPVDTSYTRDCMALVRAKVINGMSFGFNTKKDAWFDDDGNPSDRFHGTRRELLEVELVEGSPVTRPAYGGTAISARDESNALLEARQRAADSAPEVTVTGSDYTDMAAQLITAYNDLPDELKRAAEAVAELRAASIGVGDRKALAAKGHALPDGSYPIPDKSHLHAAAVLAASKHGDYKAAKALIRRRAKDLGVDVNTLPGFGKKGNRDEGTSVETRIKKGTAKRVVQMDAELAQAMELLSACDADKLPKEAQDAMALISSAKTHAGHVVKKEKLSASDTARAAQEPETSTPDDEDDFALTVAIAQATYSRDIGFV